MPIAIAPVDRQIDTSRIQLFSQRSNQCAILRVDGADAAEMLIVFDHFHHPFAGHILASQNVLKERQNFIWTSGAAE